MRGLARSLLTGFLLAGLLAVVGLAQSPEHYKRELGILRHLDISGDFLSEEVFSGRRADFEKRHYRTLIYAINNFAKITPMIRSILREQGVPEEFLYLAMVESGLQAHNVSRAKAVGIWQFMQPTAKTLGLRIDPYVDERLDPVKATQAAAVFLTQLRAEFGKWYLAILAYNCGAGKLRTAIREAGTDELAVLLDPEKKYLSLETRDFIRKILTLAFLANDKNFMLSNDPALMNYALNNDFVRVEVPGSVSLSDLAKNMEMDFKDFKKYNPHFKHNFTPPNSHYYIYIPLAKVGFFEEYFDAAKLAKVDTTIPKTQVYVVRPGDSLYSIARAHGISVNEIREYNKIKKNNLINIKQKLILPIKEKNEKIAKHDSSGVSHR